MMNEFYNTNEDFKNYVDGYCKSRCISLEVALTHELVRQVYDYYRKNSQNKQRL